MGKGAVNKLSDDLKRLVVRWLAEYVTQAEVVERLKAEYKISITKQSVQHYDPRCTQGATLNPELVALFRKFRDEYNAQVDAIPANSPNWRQEERLRLYRSTKNIIVQKDLLEEMAKEQGGVYTNKVKVAGHDGGQLEVVNLTAEERKEQLAKIFAAAKERKASGDGPDTHAG